MESGKKRPRPSDDSSTLEELNRKIDKLEEENEENKELLKNKDISAEDKTYHRSLVLQSTTLLNTLLSERTQLRQSLTRSKEQAASALIGIGSHKTEFPAPPDEYPAVLKSNLRSYNDNSNNTFPLPDPAMVPNHAKQAVFLPPPGLYCANNPLVGQQNIGVADGGSSNTPIYRLTYFNIMGWCEKIRLAFVLNNIPFIDERVNNQQWKELKPRTMYGQLPILSVDGGKEMSQSSALLNYVGRLNGSKLYPQQIDLAFKVDEVLNMIGDMDRALMPSLWMSIKPSTFGFPSDYPKTPDGLARIKKMREDFVAQQLPLYCFWFTRELEATGAFLCGDQPTIADCALWVLLKNLTRGHLTHIPCSCLDGYPVLTAYIARFAGIPEVARYYSKKPVENICNSTTNTSTVATRAPTTFPATTADSGAKN